MAAYLSIRIGTEDVFIFYNWLIVNKSDAYDVNYPVYRLPVIFIAFAGVMGVGYSKLPDNRTSSGFNPLWLDYFGD
ncbi:MAG: hypothetical protein IT448_09620 [Phycisphaerales bacterium]|nr:hypothetical protein [Phycisphaerales bacterium]